MGASENVDTAIGVNIENVELGSKFQKIFELLEKHAHKTVVIMSEWLRCLALLQCFLEQRKDSRKIVEYNGRRYLFLFNLCQEKPLSTEEMKYLEISKKESRNIYCF